MRDYWLRAAFIPNWKILGLLAWLVLAWLVLLIMISHQHTVVRTSTQCHVGGGYANEDKIVIPLTCDGIATAIDDPATVINVLTNHVTTLSCTMYQNASVSHCTTL